MKDRTKKGIEIIVTAALVGVLGNLLLRQTPWGANVTLFVAAFVAGLIVLTKRFRPDVLTFRTTALLAAMMFFGAMYSLRDAVEIKVMDTVAMIVIMGVLVLSNFGVDQRIAGVFHYAAGFAWAAVNSFLAPLMLFGSDVDWKTMPGNRLSKSIFSVLRGLVIAVPLVMIFGALFMAADAAFENFANRAINFDIDVVISHVVLTLGFAWLTAGYFRGILMEPFIASTSYVSPIPKDTEQNTSGRPDDEVSLPDNATVLEHINRSDPPDENETRDEEKKRDWLNLDNGRLPQVFTLGKIETIVILGLLDVLFLIFVAMQIPYLFGGMDHVRNTPDMSLAEYARRGFEELVVVVLLVLPVLLASHWLLRKGEAKNETLFRVLAGIQVALVFVIMISAAQRLLLLTGEFGYGMTTARFYPMVLMTWLAAVFVWFCMTVLRGGRKHFAWGALWAAIFILGATNLLNPDAFIARTNIQLMQQGREFDAAYNAQLSDDAIPVLLGAFPSMTPEARCSLGVDLHRRYGALGSMNDVRSMNYGSLRAFRVLKQNDELLHQTAACSAEYQFEASY
jgi:hypothetical protein